MSIIYQRYFSGVKYEEDKLIPVMMTLDPIPQAIIEVLSFKCKTNGFIGSINAIKYNCIAHYPAKRESNTIRNTADVSEFWKWLISINFIFFDVVSQTFLAKMVAILDIGELCSPAFYF